MPSVVVPGKDRDVLAGIEQGIDLALTTFAWPRLPRRRKTVSVFASQPISGQSHFRFRHEGHRPCGIEHIDVEPGNVVGDDQAARRDAGERRVEPDTEDVEQLPRPALLQPEPAQVADARIDQRHRAGAPQQVQNEAQGRAGHGEGRGVVFSRVFSPFSPMKWRA